MNNKTLEQRVSRLEKLVNEKVFSLTDKDYAKMELEDIIADLCKRYSRRIISNIRADIEGGTKRGVFVDIVDEIISNQSDAYNYFINICGDEDGFYDCDELDDMILDTAEEYSV